MIFADFNLGKNTEDQTVKQNSLQWTLRGNTNHGAPTFLIPLYSLLIILDLVTLQNQM